MNRIQQILSKAERDGTARRLNTEGPIVEERAPLVGPREIPRRAVRDAARDVRQEAAPVRHDAAPRLDEPRPPIDDPIIDAVGYTDMPAAEYAVEPVLHPLLIAALDPLSLAAEHYRSLRSRIAQLERDQPVRVIQVTSPGKGDGKTVTTLNLALTMAREFQRRVLVIDADLRHPRVHALLGLEAGPGLADVLTGHASLADAMVELPGHHLTVLRAGRAYDRPAEMLGSAPMRRLIDTLRAQFDRIVIDSAPAVVADPVAIAPIVDGLLLVVRAGVTTKPAIARALGSLASSRLLGLVFNDSGAPLEAPYGASA
jgi:capsular exopolysaccharide synthesis family protein